MVSKKIKNVDELIQKYIEELVKQIPVKFIILYGSYAKGNPRDWSDIDLIVVSPAFKGGTEEDYLLLSRAARKITPQIEAIPLRPEDLENYEKGDFIDEVLKNGKKIYRAA
ncbi:nucleotidyltransferase domain-containing protein [bacterium]|nr:nucleotidyltransferase domain-containing protein [bacterium]